MIKNLVFKKLYQQIAIDVVGRTRRFAAAAIAVAHVRLIAAVMPVRMALFTAVVFQDTHG